MTDEGKGNATGKNGDASVSKGDRAYQPPKLVRIELRKAITAQNGPPPWIGPQGPVSPTSPGSIVV